ncbi:MAG: glycine dehydrogenase [Planctomycetota bacterium]|nr:MAG: glycine dehydrogenase [Planctomycetota bacterium]
MTYVQNTDEDRAEMLAAIGVASVDELMEVIPPDCRFTGDLGVGRGLTEPEITRHMRELADKNIAPDSHPSFLGAGAYRHFCPSLVDNLVARTEFWTAYTPYQPEASQGTLTTIYEFQTLICRLTGMEVANASVYDGATAVIEGVMLSLRSVRKSNRVIASRGLHPDTIAVLKTYLRHIDVELVLIDLVDGATPAEAVAAVGGEGVAAVAVQSPNFHGVIEDVGALSEAAHGLGAKSIVSVDPISLSVMEAPGKLGADVVCGEGTGMGNEPWYGGPGFGFLATLMENVRQMPARIAGETTDHDGNRAVVLTFQTREQHIRRSKATSNICTSQQLMALRATIWASLLGKHGFEELGRVNLSRAHYAADALCKLPGFELAFPGQGFFKEFCLKTPKPAAEINAALLEQHGIIGGFDLGRIDPALDHHWLVAVTDVNDKQEIDALVAAVGAL